MLPAWILGTFGLRDVLDFVLQHIVGLSGLGLVGAAIACVLLAIFVPGSVTLIRTAIGVVMKGLTWLISTTEGAFVLVALGCLLAGWSARAYIDRSVALQQELKAQQAAAANAQAAAQAAAQRATILDHLNSAATKRAESAEAESDDLQAQVSDYAAQLMAAETKAPIAAAAPAQICSHALTAADVAALARIGAPRAAPKP